MQSQKFENWARLELLLKKACDVLRKQFKDHWSEISGAAWNSKSKDDFITSLGPIKPGNFITDHVKKKDIDEWDITLLSSAFRSGKLFSTAEEKELFLEYVKEIVNVRNENAHNATKSVTDEEFNDSWEKITKALLGLGLTQEELEDYRSNDLSQETAQLSESIVKAQRLKEEGNEWFKKEKYEKAIAMYTEGLMMPQVPDRDLAILYSNRSHCYLKTRAYENSLEDAKRARSLYEDWWRVHFRVGNAYVAINKLKKGIEAYNKALALNLKNEEVNQALKDARLKQGEQNRTEHLTTKWTNEDSQEQVWRATGQRLNQDELAKLKDLVIKMNPASEKVLEGHEHRDKGDYDQAVKCYVSAMKKGNAEAMYNMGQLTRRGQGVKKDFRMALVFFKQAADQNPLDDYGAPRVGVAEAEHTIGLGYEEGTLADKDIREAIAWYERALSHGYGASANNLGLIYMNGTLVERNFKKAEELFLLSIKLRDEKAMDSLTLLYIAQDDIKKAIQWNKKSIDGGSFTARSIKNDIEEYIKKSGCTGITDFEKKERSSQLFEAGESVLPSTFQSCNPFSPPDAPLLPSNIRDAYRFDTPTLLKFKDSSPYVAKIYIAVEHFRVALRALANGGSDETIVTNLAESHRLEYLAAAPSNSLKQQLKGSVRRMLDSQDPKLDQDARLCYAALHSDLLKSTVEFLSTSIRKYPDNLDFPLFRGQLYGFLGKREDSIRDFNRVLLSHANDYETIYCRAVSLRLLTFEEMSKSAVIRSNFPSRKLAIEGYERFLNVAPKDHRKYPEAYYALGHLHLLSGKKGIAKAKNYFRQGQNAEQDQLPFFKPCDSASKETLESMLANIKRFKAF